MASRKVTRAMYQKLSSRLAAHYQIALLPSFQTSEEVRRCTLEVATDATPAEDSIPVQEMKIGSSTARAMLAYDRDVNAARNIFHKHMGAARVERSHSFTGEAFVAESCPPAVLLLAHEYLTC
ncbi:hypothetical protein V7S43_001382 [Phytophthora oleae]|uniref:Transposase n=1 Tax=Phytophthora oleae TaxID=2107226 RepID=A0ABD3G963_9STRA